MEACLPPGCPQSFPLSAPLWTSLAFTGFLLSLCFSVAEPESKAGGSNIRCAQTPPLPISLLHPHFNPPSTYINTQGHVRWDLGTHSLLLPRISDASPDPTATARNSSNWSLLTFLHVDRETNAAISRRLGDDLVASWTFRAGICLSVTREFRIGVRGIGDLSSAEFPQALCRGTIDN